jgi:hemerythrin-like metal-binding protein
VQAEHEIQLGLLRKMRERVARPDGGAAAAILARQLLDYSEAHFLSEQILMREHAYPGYEAHVAEHDHLLEQLRLLVLDWDAGDGGTLAEHVARVEDWVLVHMTTTDHSLVEYLLEVRGPA